MKEMEGSKLDYRVFFADGAVASFSIEESDDLQDVEPEDLPSWALLERNRCSNCPFEPGSRRSCPVALVIHPAVDAFKDRLSYEDVRVVIEKERVKIEAVMPAQQAMLAVLRPLLFRSSCPIVARLRGPRMPITPFLEENSWIFRLLGMELVGHYLRQHGPSGLEQALRELQDAFDQFHIVSGHLAARIRSASSKDAPVNAMVHLDMVAQRIEVDISEGLKDLESLFRWWQKAETDPSHQRED